MIISSQRIDELRQALWQSYIFQLNTRLQKEPEHFNPLPYFYGEGSIIEP